MMDRSEPPVSLVTGGTGLLGSHVAERLIARGETVRALVRPGADTRFLDSLGVELIRGDLLDREACTRAVRGVDFIFHAAAKVGDWGRWAEFQRGCLDATALLASLAPTSRLRRFVHVSSTSAYGHPVEGGPPIDETAPLGQNLWDVWDSYTRSKVECERSLWRAAENPQFPLTVIRPSWLFGERDRTTTGRIVPRIRRGKMPLIGPGDNPMSAIYAGNVADAAILAAHDPGSVGEAYNVTDHGPITQREYLNLWAEIAGGPPIRKSLSYGFVFAAAFAAEAAYRLLGRNHPPPITRYATWLMGRRLSYSTRKARERLGWSPGVNYRESIERTVGWFDGNSRMPETVTLGKTEASA